MLARKAAIYKQVFGHAGPAPALDAKRTRAHEDEKAHENNASAPAQTDEQKKREEAARTTARKRTKSDYIFFD